MEITCEVCGKIVNAQRSTKRYCSAKCRLTANLTVNAITPAEIVQKLNSVYASDKESMKTWTILDAFNAVLPLTLTFDPAATPAFRVKE